jgi:hypothetical protein
MPELRVFLASRRSSSDMEIVGMERMARQALEQKLPPSVPIVITTSDKDHRDNFARLGGWPSWIEYVATGIRYDDREAVYNCFLIYETELGRANADILKKALAAGKLCMHLDPDTASLSYVDSIIDVDTNNWKSGWAAVIR